jgi:alpha-L-fucosidase
VSAAIRRTADWLVRYSAPYNSLRGVGSTNGWYAISKWMAWALNHYYGARYPTEPSVYARNTVGADWIYA